MPPTPTTGGAMPPVMDHIQKKKVCRKSTFTGPAYVIQERKKSSSLSSLLQLDENDNIAEIKEKPRLTQKSCSVMYAKGYNDESEEELIFHSKHRYSDENHQKKMNKLFDYDRVLREEKKEFEFRLANVPKPSGKLEDFIILKKLGSGQFGKVYLVQDFVEKKQYAMKAITQDTILRNDLRPEVEAERDYLYATNCPFIVSLIQHFEDPLRVYFVQEYVCNGEMYDHLREYGPFSDELTKFYTGQVVLALEYLHNVNLVYRDLKPENVMIDANGYIKLVDLGFVKRVESKTTTMIGTPAYMAPEMILNKAYDKSVDWWSLGILIFEMLAGCQNTPFADSNRLVMYEKITSKEVTFSCKFPRSPVRDLIRRLLKVNPAARLGYGTNGAKDVKSHPWFAHLNWNDLFRRNIKPPAMVRSSNPVGKISYPKQSPKITALKNALLRGTPKATPSAIQNRSRLEKLLKSHQTS